MARSPNITLLSTSALTPHPRNPRKHSQAQIRSLASSINAFGFNAPILTDKNNQILSGHARFEAAKLAGHDEVPVISLDHLSPEKARAYMLADNQLTDRSSWDDTALAVHLKELSELVLDFDIEATGFEAPELDFRIQSLDDAESAEAADEFSLATGPAVTQLGDVWILGPNQICCGNALNPQRYSDLFQGEKAAAAFSDPPYNAKIDGHVSGKGKTTHREFPMASGEMSPAEYSEFLVTFVRIMCGYLLPDALLYTCIDWRHISEMLAAGLAAGCDLLNLCVWVKSNGGMGSLYRSRHEFVPVFRNGKGSHTNNVQLGRFGRNRTNVWNYPNVNSFGRGDSRLHPTIKPIGLVADAILDSTKRDDIVLDPFLGSGTTLLAAERTNRRCFGLELDPLYVDTAIERWQRITGDKAHTRLGETYDQIKTRRQVADE
jgi:DNA modification methylase